MASKLTVKEKEALERAAAQKKAAQKFALWSGEARKLGSACRGSFVRVIKAAMRGDKTQPLFGDDRAALAVFNEAVASGQITHRTICGLSGEVLVFKMKEI